MNRTRFAFPLGRLVVVRGLAGLALAISVSAGSALAQGSADQGAVAPGTVVVSIDHAKIVRLPEKAQTVVIGNPIIADVTVQRNGILVVTGKSYGVTNLIALDAQGNMLVEANVRVEANTTATVTVHRGTERETFSCAPVCQPSLLLGDASKHFTEVSSQTTQRNTLATQQK